MVGGGDERVEEHQWEARKLATGFAGREGGQKGELRGDLERGGANGGGGGSGRRGELGSALGAGRRVEGKVEGSFAKRKEGRRARQGAQASGEAAHGTARRVRRRGASTAILGVRAGRWRRVERPRDFGRTRDGARRGHGAWPAALTRRRPRLGQH